MTSSYFELADQLVWQVIFGLEQRLVIYNQFLDGQLIRSTSSSLNKKRLVHSVYLGTGISYGKWRVTLLAVDTGDEFKGQKESNTYATLGVAFYL